MLVTMASLETFNHVDSSIPRAVFLNAEQKLFNILEENGFHIIEKDLTTELNERRHELSIAIDPNGFTNHMKKN